jgi:hypothetical protein
LIRGWKNITIWVGLAVIVALFIPAALVVPRQALFQSIDAVVFASAVALCFGNAYTTWVAIRLPIRTVGLGQLLSVGFFVICFSIAIIFGLLWEWRALGKPEWLADWTPAAFSRWMLAAGLFTAVAVNFTTGGAVSINSYRRSLSLIGVAVALSATLIWMGLG